MREREEGREREQLRNIDWWRGRESYRKKEREVTKACVRERERVIERRRER